MNEGQKNELIDLANGYIEGRLDGAEKERLEGWLGSDAEARRVFADFLHDHASLYWGHIPLGELTAADLRLLDEGEEPPATGPGRWRMAGALVLAAGGLVCLLMAVGLHRAGQPDSDERAALAPAEVPEVGSVARVIRLHGTTATGGDRTLAVGDSLDAGETVTMEEGLIELVFPDTGVHAIATAPLEMRVSSGNHLRIATGEVKLHVPPQGIGFVVETPERWITDLGTSFVVTARPGGSRVFVLDGEVSVSRDEGGAEHLMEEGEFADFRSGGQARPDMRRLSGLPELSPLRPATGGLAGMVVGFGEQSGLPRQAVPPEDYIGRRVLPLVRSGFRDQSCLEGLLQSDPVRFGGIAGAMGGVPDQVGLGELSLRHGWLVWYRGTVVAPEPGRYRFWGYADNHLLVAIDGRPVFEGSRFDSAFREELGIPRRNHLALPCLNAEAGFASGGWIELGDEPVQIDLVFGEMSNPHTSGLLLVEREGASYENTFWGQPRWPLFLTEPPDPERTRELRDLSDHLEERLKGAFSIAGDAVWKTIR